MKYLAVLCVVALAASTIAIKDELLKNNKIPKIAIYHEAENSDVCAECQSIVSRFAEAMKDPSKLAALKLILGSLCHETAYELECKLFVRKLDVFMDKLLPYLKDTKKVCHKMHMCGNERITTFHKFAVLYADKIVTSLDNKNRFLCEECRFAAQELENFVSDKSTQDEIRKFLSENVCKKIPKYQGSCDLMLEDFLPDFFKQLETLLKNAPQFCHNIGLCDKSRITHRNVEQKSAKGQVAVHEFVKNLQKIRSSKHPEIHMSCLECEIALDALIIELKQNKTIYGLADDLRNIACPILPVNMTLSCEDFLNLYAPTVVYMTMEQLTSEGICTGLIKACKPQDTMTRQHFKQLSYDEQNSVKCEACETINKHITTVLEDQEFRQHIIDGLEQNLCSYIPGIGVNVCENLMQNYLPIFFDKVDSYIKEPNMCQNILHVC
uniref:Saposin B-type domain-containing protein n=1 Tax=Parastrongyloides trichosuri TaxID=131310 RepID=A0A0N4ZDG9_PARTI